MTMDIFSPSTVIAAVTVVLTFVYYWIKNRDVVPGPIGVPYLGLYPFLTDENTYSKLEECKKKYGDVFSFTYTGRLYINLGSIKAMRELLVNKADYFADKIKDTNILNVMLGNGVTFINGEPWKILRNFFISKFKDYGLYTVRDNMAGPVYDSLNVAMEDLINLQGKPINVVEFLAQRCAYTMRKMVFGEKRITEEYLSTMNTAYAEALEGNFGVNLLLVGPIARLLFRVKPSFRKNLNCYKKLAKLIRESVREVEGSMDEEHPTCIIEEYYKERNKRRRENDPTWKYFSDDTLVETLFQFIGDGIQAVAALIAGLLNALVVYPDEQQMVYSELMEVIGPNRQPTAEDRPKLSYTNAFINEYIRHEKFINHFPTLVCTSETTYRGYRIPLGSILLLNFRSAHHDRDTFDDPETFNPSRFVPSPGKPKAESPVGFAMGRRSCSGEPFVMLQAFLFLTTIVKNFNLVASSASENPSVEDLLAGKVELTFVPRAEN